MINFTIGPEENEFRKVNLKLEKNSNGIVRLMINDKWVLLTFNPDGTFMSYAGILDDKGTWYLDDKDFPQFRYGENK